MGLGSLGITDVKHREPTKSDMELSSSGECLNIPTLMHQKNRSEVKLVGKNSSLIHSTLTTIDNKPTSTR